MSIKTCKDCGENKPLSEYYSQTKIKKKTNETYSYYQPYCKSCASKRSGKWQQDNHEYYLKHKSDYHKKSRIENVERREYDRQHARDQKETGYSKEYYEKNKQYFIDYQKNRMMNKTHEISNEEWLRCKEYFENSCSYCGLHQNYHYIIYAGKPKKTDLHKEHVNHNGSNKIDNCVPACQTCNCKKWAFPMDIWYREQEFFSEERLSKINKWLETDYSLMTI
jgi:hypothetical protein